MVIANQSKCLLLTFQPESIEDSKSRPAVAFSTKATSYHLTHGLVSRRIPNTDADTYGLVNEGLAAFFQSNESNVLQRVHRF